MTHPPAAADRVVALDVGGANLKAADGLGWTASEPFAMWQRPGDLADVLVTLVRDRRPDRLVATMTGEIADCFACRAAGVAHIVTALERAAAATASDPAIYLVSNRQVASLATPAEAHERPLDAAAANWHALARLAAHHAPGDCCLLVDVGSTTTDIVPLVAGAPAPWARHDADRMRSGELVYTGIERTPLAAIARTLPHRGLARPVAAERFADSRDAWLVLGALPEDADCSMTADGGPATVEAARVRLARSLLLDPDDLSPDDAVVVARRCATLQARRVAAALARVAERLGRPPDAIVLSGHGTELARRGLQHTGWASAVVSLPDILGAAVSRVAPAHALALLARGLLP